MNLIRVLVLLTFAAVGQAKKDGHPDGTCGEFCCEGFNEEDYGCYFSYEAGQVCPFPLCWGYGNVKNDRFGIHMAAWNPQDKAGTIQCMYAKGYQNEGPIDVYDDAGEKIAERTIIHGHGGQLFEADDSVAEDVKNMKTPGAYWMQGATVVFQGDCDVTEDPPNWDCGTELVTKAKGKLLDICHEIQPGIDTHCTPLSEMDCKSVNTCSWDDGECVYDASLNRRLRGPIA